jgi:hypothetical protein
MSVGEAYKYLTSSPFVGESIYNDPSRLAQPDEIWNYKRGDGLEKAVTLASIYINKDGHNDVAIDIHKKNVKLTCGNKEFTFETCKTLPPPDDKDWLF